MKALHDAPARRRWLLAALAGGLAACTDKGPAWPEGMKPIHWDRDACARCGMVISDRRFAVQARGGGETLNFDDIGCAVVYRSQKGAQHPWMAGAAARWWVADVAAEDGTRWLDARQAHYVAGVHSPMGYDFAAHGAAQPGSLGFDAMAARVLAAEGALRP